nr:EOG090X09TV [Cyclestheria hislopi]
MRLMKPKLQQLRFVLENHTYEGMLLDENKESKGMSFSELKTIIQCSETELLNELSELDTVKINGKWRLLEINLQYGWVLKLDTVLQEKELALSQVTITDIMDWMKDFELEAVNNKCVSMFLEESDENLHWNQMKVSRLFAVYLLRELKEIRLNDFMVSWQQSVPEGIKTCEEQLKGIAIINMESTPSVVKYYPEFILPEDVNERLQELFHTRSKWTLPDITPYIQPLCDSRMDVNSVLTKYARLSTVNGVKYYSSKYAR